MLQDSVANASIADWNIIAGAAGAFIVTSLITWQGLRKGKKKVESGSSEITSIVGATLMETSSMKELSESLRENSQEIRHNTAALTRATDVAILTRRDHT